MKKTLLTLSALALMATATPALAALDETEISVIDMKPSEFARDFNRLNKANGQAFKPIKLSNTYGEQRVNLAPNIYMLVGAHTDAIEYIDYICNKPALTSKKCDAEWYSSRWALILFCRAAFNASLAAIRFSLYCSESLRQRSARSKSFSR